jgi:thiamine-phosphate pyrophosphorylase
VAIGGITLDRAADVIEAGATAVAVITDLIASGDPEGRVRAYLARLSQRGQGIIPAGFGRELKG